LKPNFFYNLETVSGTSLRVGDKLVAVNGKPTHEMWTQRVDGVLRLSFDEKRKKRKPRPETIPEPKIVLAIKEGEMDLYLNPNNVKTKKLAKSGGAIATISDVMKKLEMAGMNAEKREKESNSSASLDEDRKIPVVTKIGWSVE